MRPGRWNNSKPSHPPIRRGNCDHYGIEEERGDRRYGPLYRRKDGGIHHQAVGPGKLKLPELSAVTYNGNLHTPTFVSVTNDPDSEQYEKSAYKVSSTLTETLMPKDYKGVLFVNEVIGYDIDYLNNTEASTATVLFKGIINYNGMAKATFKINAREFTQDDVTGTGAPNTFSIGLDADPADVQGIANRSAEPEYAYNGSTIKPKPVVKFTYRNDADAEPETVTLTKSTDYTLGYTNNKAVTPKDLEPDSTKQPNVTIKLRGGYSGKLTKTFTIIPLPLTNNDRVKVTVAELADSASARESGEPKVTVTYTGVDPYDGVSKTYLILSSAYRMA